MKKKLVKLLTICLSIATLALSHSSAAWAKADSEVTPGEYTFFTVLSACGINPYKYSGQWLTAYKGYLQSTNNTAMLNQLNSYNSLSWGDTATNIDALYDSVRSWLSLSDSYGTDSFAYTLPSLATPSPDKASTSGEHYIHSQAFSGINPITMPDYEYLFSDVYNVSSQNPAYYVRRNVYEPKNVEVFGVVTGMVAYTDKILVKFYEKDNTSDTGYKLIDLQSMGNSYYCGDDSLRGKGTSPASWNYVEIKLLDSMNFPFKIFGNTADAETYVKTGVANYLTNKNNCYLRTYPDDGINVNLQNAEKFNISSNLQLPKDNAIAMAAFHDTKGAYDLATASEKLKACGLDIDYQDTYKVEHYKQNLDSEGFTKADEESLTGAAGDVASYTAKTYDGFNLDTSLTTPDSLILPGNGSLVIKLYYKREDINYTVEHYQQGLDGNGWIKADTESLSGVFGSKATYTAKSYPGLKYDSSLTTPTDKDLELASGKDLVIKLYYKRDAISYTVEHYQQNTSGDSWTKKDTDSFTGFHGATATHTPKSYTGFTLDSSLTVPKNLQLVSGNKMVVKLYYKRNSINYTVNHHQQALNGKDWVKADTEALTGLYGSNVSYSAKVYPGFSYDDSLTKIKDKVLKEEMEINLYYKRDMIKYRVEHYQGTENADKFTYNWTLAETENLTGVYGSKATYNHKNYNGYVHDATKTVADNITLTEDNKVVIKMYYIKPYGVDIVENSMQGVVDALWDVTIATFGIVGVGLVSLIILKFFRRTALQVVTNNELSKKANMVSDYNKKSRSTKSSSSRSKTSK